MLTTALLRIQLRFHGYSPFTMTTARFLREKPCFHGYGTVTMLTGCGGSKEVCGTSHEWQAARVPRSLKLIRPTPLRAYGDSH